MLEADRRPTDADGPRPRKKAKTAQHRDLASPLLYVHRDTLACALGRCVPCLYKVWPGGRRGLPPNVRPELCPRARDAAAARRADARGAVGLYRRGERVLTVGDGDFTFSLALSRLLARSRAAAAADAADAGAERAPARAPMVFTSHESRESVLRTYPNAPATLRALDALAAAGAARVVHGVDATALDAAALGGGAPFDVVCWNFPCVSLPAGRDGQATELAANRALLRAFFASVARGGRGGGGRGGGGAEVHVTHKTIEPFSWWDVPALAAEAGFALARRVVFDKCLYAGYTNRKALDRKGFACNDAETLVFELRDARDARGAGAGADADGRAAERDCPEMLVPVAGSGGAAEQLEAMLAAEPFPDARRDHGT